MSTPSTHDDRRHPGAPGIEHADAGGNRWPGASPSAPAEFGRHPGAGSPVETAARPFGPPPGWSSAGSPVPTGGQRPVDQWPGAASQEQYGAWPGYAQATQMHGMPMGNGPDGGGAPGVLPRPLDIATKLMWAGAALTALGCVLGMLAIGERADEVLRANPRLSALPPEQLDSMIRVLPAFAMTSLLVFGGLAVAMWSWMAVMNRRGRTWARITATVLGGIGIVSGLGIFAQPFALETVVVIVRIAVSIAALVFLWRKENNPYYQAMSARGF